MFTIRKIGGRQANDTLQFLRTNKHKKFIYGIKKLLKINCSYYYIRLAQWNVFEVDIQITDKC